MEDFYSCDIGLAGGDRRVDADPLEHLELMRVAYDHPNFKPC